jgi:hypothetical protein
MEDKAACFMRESVRHTWDVACFLEPRGEVGGAGCLVYERVVQAYLGFGLLSLSLGAGWGSKLHGS